MILIYLPSPIEHLRSKVGLTVDDESRAEREHIHSANGIREFSFYLDLATTLIAFRAH